jgi:hypothetical protein
MPRGGNLPGCGLDQGTSLSCRRSWHQKHRLTAQSDIFDAEKRLLISRFKPFQPFNRYCSVQADSSEVKDQTLWAIKFWSEDRSRQSECESEERTQIQSGPSEGYGSDFTGKNEVLSSENTRFWNDSSAFTEV